MTVQSWTGLGVVPASYTSLEFPFSFASEKQSKFAGCGNSVGSEELKLQQQTEVEFGGDQQRLGKFLGGF